MTPAAAITMLDRQLEMHGQTVALRRGTGSVHSCPAFVRGYDIEKVVGLVTLADRKVIASPTGLGAFGIPRLNDDFSTQGKLGKVQEAEPIYVQDVLVRIELRVRML